MAEEVSQPLVAAAAGDGGAVSAAASSAVDRALAFGALQAGDADAMWQLVQSWVQADELQAELASHGGCHYLVLRVAAAQPAFSPGQRQGLLVTARLEPSRAGGVSARPAGVAVARGGWLVAQALALASSLRNRQVGGELAAARDLAVTIEIDERLAAAVGVAERSDQAVQDVLRDSACAVAEWGGWPLTTDDKKAIPYAIGQKGRALLQIEVRGEAADPALPAGDSAIDVLRQLLDRVAAISLPWRRTASAAAFVSAMSRLEGLGRSLAWRTLLGSGAWNRALKRFPSANHALIGALFHDTIAVTELRSSADGAAATATLDCRLLPGSKTDALVERVRAAVGERARVEVVRSRPALESPVHGPFARLLQQHLGEAMGGGQPVPMLMPGSCDALGWRQTAVPCYGFAPLGLAASQDALRSWSRGTLQPTREDMALGARAFIELATRFVVAV